MGYGGFPRTSSSWSWNGLWNVFVLASLRAASQAPSPRTHRRTLLGSFRAVVYAGVDALTKRPRYLKETFKTYTAAEVALTRLQAQVDDERHPKTNITVGQALDQWLEVAQLADTTRDRYEDLIRIYIRPSFGSVPAAKLDAETLERFYARLQRCRDLCDGRVRRRHACRPLTGSTVRQIHYVISGGLERAVRWRHLGMNKAAFAVAPSPNGRIPIHRVPRKRHGYSLRVGGS